MGSTVKDKRQWQHSHQACSRKVQGGNNGASRKALIPLFKVAIESFQFSIFFSFFFKICCWGTTFCWHNFLCARSSKKKLCGEADRNLLLRKPQRHPEKPTCSPLHWTLVSDGAPEPLWAPQYLTGLIIYMLRLDWLHSRKSGLWLSNQLAALCSSSYTEK